MPGDFTHIWVYLAASPLLWLVVTLGVYVLAASLYQRTNGFALAQPVLVSVVVIAAILLVTGVPYERYFEGAQFIHFLLGPATVALAVPLYQNVERMRRAILPAGIALVCGSATAVVSAVVIARSLGASDVVLRSLAPKSVTAPIAMGISEQIGGLPSLTAALVILTGIAGAMLVPSLFVAARISDPRARGLAIGTAAHGIGTARALLLGSTEGAFSGLAMGLNGVVSSLIVPPLVAALLR